MIKNFENLFLELKIKPHDYRLYEIAFTHPSVNVDRSKVHNDYQRLEFVGDSTLGNIIATLSYKLKPLSDEGFLTRLRSFLVNTESLSSLALQFHLQNYIQVGVNFKNDLSKSLKVLEDVFEALIGAIYLDRGFKYVFKFVEKIFKDKIINFNYQKSIDFKTSIQELLQSNHHRVNLKYCLAEKKGASNSPIFKMNLFCNGKFLGSGSGSSKKKAEQDAAKNALDKLQAKNKN